MLEASERELTPPGFPGGAANPDADLAGRMVSCARELIATAAALGWRGSDLHDGLYWAWPRPLVATTRRRQVIQQLHARSPVDLRRWRQSPRPRLAKTLALFAKAALINPKLWATGQVSDFGLAAVKELAADHSAGSQAWGYPFPVQTRWSSYPANSPNVVVTSFAIDALLLAAEHAAEPAPLVRAEHAAEWILEKLVTSDGHIAYHEHSDVLVHNASVLGAGAVFRALGAEDVARRAIEPTLAAQRSDGSWPYGAGGNLRFVDNFHTAYVLSSLIAVEPVDPAVAAAVDRGAAYWAERFFDARGRARMWPNRPFPEDGHSAGTALSTLSLLAAHDTSYVPLLSRVAERALTEMVVDGRAVHRRYRWGRTRVNYLRWCDGHMAAGMAAGAAALARAGAAAGH